MYESSEFVEFNFFKDVHAWLLITIFFGGGGCFVEFYWMFIQRNTISQQGDGASEDLMILFEYILLHFTSSFIGRYVATC